VRLLSRGACNGSQNNRRFHSSREIQIRAVGRADAADYERRPESGAYCRLINRAGLMATVVKKKPGDFPPGFFDSASVGILAYFPCAFTTCSALAISVLMSLPEADESSPSAKL